MLEWLFNFEIDMIFVKDKCFLYNFNFVKCWYYELVLRIDDIMVILGSKGDIVWYIVFFRYELIIIWFGL